MSDFEAELANWKAGCPSAEADRRIRDALAGRTATSKAADSSARRLGVLDMAVLIAATVLLIFAAFRYVSAKVPPKSSVAGEGNEATPEFTAEEEAKIARAIAWLASDDFAERKKGSDVLQSFGERIELRLEALVREAKDAEVKARAQDLLEALNAKFDAVRTSDGATTFMKITQEDYVSVRGVSRGRPVEIPSFRVINVRHADEDDEYRAAKKSLQEQAPHFAVAVYHLVKSMDSPARPHWAAEYCRYEIAKNQISTERFDGYLGKTGTKYEAPAKYLTALLEGNLRSRFMPEAIVLLPRCILRQTFGTRADLLSDAQTAIKNGLKLLATYRKETAGLAAEYAQIADDAEKKLKSIAKDVEDEQNGTHWK